MPLFLICHCCGHRWFILGALLFDEQHEEIVVIRSNEDLCPLCEAQGEVYWVAVLEDFLEDDTILEEEYHPQPVVEADPAAYDPILFG